MAPLYLSLKGVYLKELRKFAKEPEGSSFGFRDLIPRIDRSMVKVSDMVKQARAVSSEPSGTVASG